MVENQAENVATLVENPTEAPQVQEVDRNKEDNLIRMRKKLEAAEEATREAQKRADEAERRRPYNNETQPEKLDSSMLHDDSIDIEDEDYVQAKYLKKNAKKVDTKLKSIEDRLEQLQQENAILRAEKATDKKAKFDEIVSPENLKTLARLYPDDYECLMSSNNLKSKSVTAYNMMIRYGIADDPEKESKKIEALKAIDNRIEDNKLRPGSSANAKVSASPLINASRYDSDGRLVMTDADRDRINRSMRQKMGYE